VRVAIYAVGALVALVLVMLAVGYMLPQGHHVWRERTFAVPPDRLFARISSPVEFPTWRSGVRQVEVLPAEAGKDRFREVSADGTILYEVEERVPPQRLVIRIADRDLPFGGRWIYELTPAASGTRLRITEDGEVYNPLFRFLSRFVFGHHGTIDRYLADLEKVAGAT
jgi:uncharacterized protein YndB with AHSA1/START domain